MLFSEQYNEAKGHVIFRAVEWS